MSQNALLFNIRDIFIHTCIYIYIYTQFHKHSVYTQCIYMYVFVVNPTFSQGGEFHALKLAIVGGVGEGCENVDEDHGEEDGDEEDEAEFPIVTQFHSCHESGVSEIPFIACKKHPLPQCWKYSIILTLYRRNSFFVVFGT